MCMLVDRVCGYTEEKALPPVRNPLSQRRPVRRAAAIMDSIRPHMWFNLSGSWGFEERDAVAAKMTPAQIDEAQRLAREWKTK